MNESSSNDRKVIDLGDLFARKRAARQASRSVLHLAFAGRAVATLIHGHVHEEESVMDLPVFAPAWKGLGGGRGSTPKASRAAYFAVRLLGGHSANTRAFCNAHGMALRSGGRHNVLRFMDSRHPDPLLLAFISARLVTSNADAIRQLAHYLERADSTIRGADLSIALRGARLVDPFIDRNRALVIGVRDKWLEARPAPRKAGL